MDSSTPEGNEFKEKARKLMYKTELRDFPVILEMYLHTFEIETSIDKAMSEIVAIIRTSKDAETAYNLVSHYLDSLEKIA